MHTRAPAEPEVREFTAEVVGTDDRTVTLDRTYFYAESGGQPADRGTLDGIRIVDVQTVDGVVRHTLAEAPPFATGERVTGVVDDDFRAYCMRAHTASHVLYGAGRRLLDDLGYGGFDISESKVRVDFTTTTDIDDDVLVELERLVNRAVWDSRAVSWNEVPTDEATADDEVAFNTKTEEGVIDDADTVRIVEIDGWDRAACGGTHVSNTREIGPVTLLERSNPGEGLTRVEFAVGPDGIDRRATHHRALRDATGALETSVAEVAEMAESVRTERDDLRDRVRELERAAVEDAIDAFETVEKGGTEWRIGVLSDADTNDAGEAAKDAVGDDEVICAVEDGDRPSLVVAAGPDSGVEAGDVIDAVTDTFGGGGGGGPPFAQGGGLDAESAAVVDALRGWEPSK